MTHGSEPDVWCKVQKQPQTASSFVRHWTMKTAQS